MERQNMNQHGFTPPKGWENRAWQPGVGNNLNCAQVWPIGEDGKPLDNEAFGALIDEEARTIYGHALPVVEDNWHAESDKLGFWLIMSIPLGFLFAALLVFGVYAVADLLR